MNLGELRRSDSAVVTVTDTARLLGVDERTVSRAAKQGQLPAVWVGRRLLIPREPLVTLLTLPREPHHQDPAEPRIRTTQPVWSPTRDESRT